MTKRSYLLASERRGLYDGTGRTDKPVPDVGQSDVEEAGEGTEAGQEGTEAGQEEAGEGTEIVSEETYPEEAEEPSTEPKTTPRKTSRTKKK